MPSAWHFIMEDLRRIWNVFSKKLTSVPKSSSNFYICKKLSFLGSVILFHGAQITIFKDTYRNRSLFAVGEVDHAVYFFIYYENCRRLN